MVEDVVVDVDVVGAFVVEAMPLVDVTGVLGGSTVGLVCRGASVVAGMAKQRITPRGPVVLHSRPLLQSNH